jgi:hypothetical protein
VSYRVVTDVLADAEILEFARYAASYSEDFAKEQFARLNRVFTVDLSESPNIWSTFYLTGLPNRGYLFRVGRRTSIWIVYTVDDDTKIVRVLRFWTPARTRQISSPSYPTTMPGFPHAHSATPSPPFRPLHTTTTSPLSHRCAASASIRGCQISDTVISGVATGSAKLTSAGPPPAASRAST